MHRTMPGPLTPILLMLMAGGAVMAESTAQPTEPFRGKWERVTERAEFCIRDTAEDFVLDGKLWISNGYIEGGKLIRDLWNSADGVAWTRMLEETPYDGYSEIAMYEGAAWAVKGSVWRSTDGLQWSRVAERTPFGARGYGELVVHDGRMWQLGSGADVWWTKDGINWTCAVADAPFGRRYGSAVAVYKGKLWLVGGAEEKTSDPPEKHYAQYTTHNDVWCSEDGATWLRVCEHAPFAERMWFVAREFADRLWVFGGFSNRQSINYDECWYTEDGVTWKKLEVGPHWSPRHEPTIWVFGDCLWLAAGNSWPLQNDVWRLRSE